MSNGFPKTLFYSVTGSESLQSGFACTRDAPAFFACEKGPRGVAVVRSLKDYEKETEECAFMQGAVKGLMDLEEGREISFSESRQRLGLK